jgi:hypothetical protein
VPRQALELPASPVRTPLSAAAFAEHLPIAVAAGSPLALVLVRADASRRGRARLYRALRAAGGFSYALDGGYALLLPGATAWDAFRAAVMLKAAARGTVLRPGAYLDAGIATLEPGVTATELFARATEALEDAGDAGGGVRAYAGATRSSRVLPV